MTKEPREIFMSFQWGGDCARNIISKKFTCIGMELVVNIAKNDLSKSYDRVRYEIIFYELKNLKFIRIFLKKLPR